MCVYSYLDVLFTSYTTQYFICFIAVEAGTLYTEGSWWWIVIVVLIIFLVLLLFAYLVTKYVRHLQTSGKYDVKGTKIKPNKPKNETIHEPIVLHL